MDIVKAVLKNQYHGEIALVTDIGAIPFIYEGDEYTQELIDLFENGSHALDDRWAILDDYEKTEFYDVSDHFWL